MQGLRWQGELQDVRRGPAPLLGLAGVARCSSCKGTLTRNPGSRGLRAAGILEYLPHTFHADLSESSQGPEEMGVILQKRKQVSLRVSDLPKDTEMAAKQQCWDLNSGDRHLTASSAQRDPIYIAPSPRPTPPPFPSWLRLSPNFVSQS